jgi:hypothetical protein
VPGAAPWLPCAPTGCAATWGPADCFGTRARPIPIRSPLDRHAAAATLAPHTVVSARRVQLQARLDHINRLQAARLHDAAHGACKHGQRGQFSAPSAAGGRTAAARAFAPRPVRSGRRRGWRRAALAAAAGAFPPGAVSSARGRATGCFLGPQRAILRPCCPLSAQHVLGHAPCLAPTPPAKPLMMGDTV